MKPLQSKSQQRSQLEQEVQQYLEQGGEVTQVPKGSSGNMNNTNLFRSATTIDPKAKRTPLTEVVKALDERKTKKSTPSEYKRRKPKKRLIVDDFGDPVRWVWDE